MTISSFQITVVTDKSIAQDMDLNKMMAELAGKATGVSKGRGGSMHLADFEKGNYGTNGIVGGGMLLP